MRILSKVITGVLAAAVIMTAGLATSTQAKAAVTSSQAKSAYQAFMGQNKKVSVPCIDGYDYNNVQMKKFTAKKKSISLKPFVHYIFQDINGDGNSELLVSNQRKEKDGFGKIMICTYQNNKVKPVLLVDGIRNGIYLGSGNRICFGFGASTSKTYAFAKLSGTTMKSVGTFCRESVRVGGGKFDNTYYKNGKKTTAAKFKKAQKMVKTKLF